MKELDFDELDKAVSSLMVDGKYGGDDDASAKSDAPVLEINSTPPAASNVDAPVSEPKPSAVASTSLNATQPDSANRSKPLAMRRGGRFMDVVHSSSDMKARPEAATPPSRQGLSLAPLSPNLKDELAAQPTATIESSKSVTVPAYDDTDQVASTELENRSDTQEPDAKASNSGEDIGWPDPIEVSELLEADSAKGQDDSTKPDMEEAAESYDDKQPLYSPFVPGAKVEKRPLGHAIVDSTPSYDNMVDLNGEPDSQNIDNDSNEQLEQDKTADDQLPATAEERLPAELQDDLMAIEADTSLVSESEATVSEVKDDKSAPQEHIVAPEPTAQLTPTASIAPQYKEEPKKDNLQQGDIYDTKNYHQPLSHPQKKKSGWLWVLWIVLLIAFGVAGGAALYLYVL